MTKAQESHYRRYLWSSDYSLWDAYGRFSNAKAKAWEYCESLMAKKNGRGLKVVGHNCNVFTAGFLFEEDGKEYFMYITPTRDEIIEVTDYAG